MRHLDQDQYDFLRIEDLKTYYFTLEGILKAVDGVDMQINRGELIGLIGESGCGKSTLALSITNLLPKQAKIMSGRILFKGTDMTQLENKKMIPLRGNEISMIFQDPTNCLNPIMRVKDQISESILTHQDIEKFEAEDKVFKILEDLDLPSPQEIANNYPHQLSGGMKQRIMIGVALALNPSLLIADEPTSSLDVSTQLKILDLLRKKCKSIDTSLLMITHDLGIIAEICERVFVMYSGRIVESANVYNIFFNPAHPYAKALINSSIRVDQTKKIFSTIKGEAASVFERPSGCIFNIRCEKAKNRCLNENPPKVKISDDHFVYCWEVEGEVLNA
jgi:oligopeptide/dipeptide ABC transporter ATP-binding protein